MAVKNKNALVKLLESAMGEPMDSLRNENGYYALNESEFPMFMKVGDDSFEMVSNKDFFGKSNTNWDSELASFASSQPGTFYLNLNYQMYPDLTKEMGRDFDRMRPFLDMLKDVRGTMSGMNSHFEINFTESKDPILYRFMLAVNDAYVRNRPMKEVSEN
jgi:hypothetical protein